VDLGWVRLCQGDLLLVCSDGLYGCVADEVIAQTLATAENPEKASDTLVEKALAAGAPDNVTVLVARFRGSLPSESEPPELRKVEFAER
jgi:serine/threonine protein phosphatase PrpC